MLTSSPFPPPSICVVDSVCVIGLKRAIKIDDQWAYFENLTLLLHSGWLAFPKQVVAEVRGAQYPDMPGAWIAANRMGCRHPSPSDEALAEVLALLAPQRPDASLVEVNATLDKADPYLVAMAYDLQQRHRGSRVLVATDDVTDRPWQLSPASACADLGIEQVDMPGFLEWVDGALAEMYA